MTTKTRTTTDSDIRQVIIDHGFADCSIVRQYVKDRFENHGTDGVWYVLAVPSADGTWNVWGRRRTLVELLALAERGPLFLR